MDKPGYDDFESGDVDLYYLGLDATNLSVVQGWDLELIGNGTSGAGWQIARARLTIGEPYNTHSIPINCNVDVWLDPGTKTTNLKK